MYFYNFYNVFFFLLLRQITKILVDSKYKYSGEASGNSRVSEGETGKGTRREVGELIATEES